MSIPNPAQPNDKVRRRLIRAIILVSVTEAVLLILTVAWIWNAHIFSLVSSVK